MNKKVQVGEVILANSGSIDDFIRILVENGYVAVIEKVDSTQWQITIVNKVLDN